jgi:hypothetical protein
MLFLFNCYIRSCNRFLKENPTRYLQVYEIINLLFVGLYWGYDARLWPCEEAKC